MHTPFMTSRLLATALFFSSLCAPAWAAPSKAVPTDIKADHMAYDADQKNVVFTGNVHVKRPDFELWSKTLTVYFKPSDKIKSESEEEVGTIQNMNAGEIDRIVARNNVVMKSEGKEGRCEVATYHTNSDTFVMEGSPNLREKDNVLRGTKIVHHMAANKSEVMGGVEANFVTPDKSEQGSLVPTGRKK
ncbi:LptA/OstA family protein [Desulfovibrio cuneatus]|uniref:LptA/OstA family protein n=1 Tax=Desulfovibrio cuneatus TaxID=159728 RepID=UPI000684C783|nr:LptA/OstA family protein [Desulfovibrio cuneatus]